MWVQSRPAVASMLVGFTDLERFVLQMNPKATSVGFKRGSDVAAGAKPLTGWARRLQTSISKQITPPPPPLLQNCGVHETVLASLL